MNDFDAVLATRISERGSAAIHKARKCDECGEVKYDVDLFAEDTETGERIYLCPLCVAKDDMAHHDHDEPVAVIGLVKFDGKKAGVLPHGWYIDHAYGTLMEDGRILHGLPAREVKPESFERVQV